MHRSPQGSGSCPTSLQTLGPGSLGHRLRFLRLSVTVGPSGAATPGSPRGARLGIGPLIAPVPSGGPRCCRREGTFGTPRHRRHRPPLPRSGPCRPAPRCGSPDGIPTPRSWIAGERSRRIAPHGGPDRSSCVRPLHGRVATGVGADAPPGADARSAGHSRPRRRRQVLSVPKPLLAHTGGPGVRRQGIRWALTWTGCGPQ